MGNAAKKDLQTTQRRGSENAAKKGFKRPPGDLAEWIRLANLVEPGQVLPDRLDLFVPGTWPSILEKIAKLEDPLRWELLAYSELPKEVSVRGKTEQLSYDNPDMARVRRVYHRFQQIQAAATYIGLLARPVLARPDAEATLDILESFVSSLRYAELPYLRQCGVCGKIFYAKRRTQKGCTTRHSTTLYKREQYAKKLEKTTRDKANRMLKKEGKVK